jgi:hypothetical protein
MERLPKIIIMIVAMTAIFLWVSTAFNSCGDKDLIEDTDDIVSDSGDEIDYSDAVGDDIFGSTDEEDEEDFLFDDKGDAEEESTYDDDTEEVDFTSPVADDNDYEPSKPVSTRPSSYSSSGEWMVIAGNYLVESNARVMIRKLRNLGYNNSEIGVFERSQYHTVIASRHTSNSAAIKAANQIKNRGVECYVKKKEY